MFTIVNWVYTDCSKQGIDTHIFYSTLYYIYIYIRTQWLAWLVYTSTETNRTKRKKKNQKDRTKKTTTEKAQTI